MKHGNIFKYPMFNKNGYRISKNDYFINFNRDNLNKTKWKDTDEEDIDND
jgi:hypothetical protein